MSRASTASIPAWRARIAEAVKPHGRLTAIASGASMPSQQLLKIANGTTREPSVVTLARIATAMGLTLAELVSEKPRPEEPSGHADESRPRAGNPVFAGIAEAVDVEVPAEDTWRGDVLKAVAVLNRALRRGDSEAAAGPAAKTRR